MEETTSEPVEVSVEKGEWVGSRGFLFQRKELAREYGIRSIRFIKVSNVMSERLVIATVHDTGQLTLRLSHEGARRYHRVWDCK